MSKRILKTWFRKWIEKLIKHDYFSEKNSEFENRNKLSIKKSSFGHNILFACNIISIP